MKGKNPWEGLTSVERRRRVKKIQMTRAANRAAAAVPLKLRTTRVPVPVALVEPIAPHAEPGIEALGQLIAAVWRALR